MAGAIVGEIWIDSQSAKCCNFQYRIKCLAKGENKAPRTGGFSFAISCSDYGRPRIVNDASTVFSRFSSYFGMPFCVAGAAFGEVGG